MHTHTRTHLRAPHVPTSARHAASFARVTTSHDARQASDLSGPETAPLIEFVGHMTDHFTFDTAVLREFKTISAALKCHSEPPTTVLQAIDAIQKAAASKDYVLLPSFEGLQQGKLLLGLASKVANERAVTHRHLEQLAAANTDCEKLEKASVDIGVYSKDNLTAVKEVYAALENTRPKLKEDADKDTCSL